MPANATELLLEDPVLFTKVLSADPASQRRDEDLPGLQRDGHPLIVAWSSRNGQLSERRTDRVESP
jgi:hypothetical protein